MGQRTAGGCVSFIFIFTLCSIIISVLFSSLRSYPFLDVTCPIHYVPNEANIGQKNGIVVPWGRVTGGRTTGKSRTPLHIGAQSPVWAVPMCATNPRLRQSPLIVPRTEHMTRIRSNPTPLHCKASSGEPSSYPIRGCNLPHSTFQAPFTRLFITFIRVPVFDHSVLNWFHKQHEFSPFFKHAPRKSCLASLPLGERELRSCQGTKRPRLSPSHLSLPSLTLISRSRLVWCRND